MKVVNKNITLLSLLKEIERMGYTVLTYEEAECQLGIKPNEFGKNYVFVEIDNKYYLFLNEISINSKTSISEYIRNDKLKKIKNILYSILENNYILEHKRSF